MPITRRLLEGYTWYTAFESLATETRMRVVQAKENPDVAIIHTWKDGGKVKITYSVFGHRFESPSEAIRKFNEEERARIAGRRNTAGSAEQIAARKI